MIDFEKIGDTFEEGFENVKDFTKKNKVLTIAICGVGAFALYKLFTDKSKSQDTEYASTYAYVPTGYDGYPEMSESVSYDDVVEQLRTETSDINEEFYNETMSDVSQMINDAFAQNKEEYEPVVQSNKNYSVGLTTDSYLEEQRKKEAIIKQMSANSEAWHNASDEEKERLHNENVALGNLLGAEFDSGTGTWSQNGSSLYDVPVKNKTNTSTAELTNVGVKESSASTSKKTSSKTSSSSGSSGSSGSSNSSDVISQMKANSEAWHSASDSEKKELAQKNQELGKSIGASFDSASGTWSKDGTKLY